ncbi:hypothetical protein N7478_009572 [Penicillium angulare]|uniref:uncharacterized protein n=1 Tax=Penicillium angulare TaxID=116970 RepID=UPI00253F9F3E|nr:uncharacterized protein N7478_009572 [Penicillium angulare]KAJ5266764.1 hypothetical protein N7478_009572 [Penicillium angulare]
MYVYRNKDLPQDPSFPSDLKELGYFISDKDQIRRIANPEEGFIFKINRNERFNIVQREAMNDCIREIVAERLTDAGLKILPLPLDTELDEAHVPILVSKEFHEKPRIILYLGEPNQDLGIFAYRAIHEGISFGSAVNLTKAALVDKNVGLIIGNTGQLIWHNESVRAVTHQTWQAIPRPFANWGQATTSLRNKIPGHHNWDQHVQYIFEKVLWPKVGKETSIDIIGMSEGGHAAVKYLQKDWHVWKPYISGIALADPQQTTYCDIDMGMLTDPQSFTSFLASRCRAYILSAEPVGTPQPGYRTYGCNCYSSGENLNTECIIPAAWENILAWLNEIDKNPEYSEHVMLCDEDMDEAMLRELEEQAKNELTGEAAEIEWLRVIGDAAAAERDGKRAAEKEAEAEEEAKTKDVQEEHDDEVENLGDYYEQMKPLEIVGTDAKVKGVEEDGTVENLGDVSEEMKKA